MQQSIIEDDFDVEEDIEEELDTLKDTRDIDLSNLPQLGQALVSNALASPVSYPKTEVQKSQKSKFMLSIHCSLMINFFNGRSLQFLIIFLLW